MTPELSAALPYLIPLLAVVLIVRRSLRARRVRVERLWVMPVVLAAATLASMAQERAPTPLVIGGLFAALAVGAAGGWLRGRGMRLAVDPVTHELTSRATPIATIAFAALFLARYALRLALRQNPDALGAHDPAVAQAITDAFLLFALGLMSAQRLEMGLRGMQLVREARASTRIPGTATLTPPPYPPPSRTRE